MKKLVKESLNESEKIVANIMQDGYGDTIGIEVNGKEFVYDLTDEEIESEEDEVIIEMWKKIEQIAKEMGATHTFDDESDDRPIKIGKRRFDW